MSANFKYGELDIEFDSSDYVILERYRDETNKYVEIMSAAPTTDLIETLKYTVKAMTDLLDAVLGDGASNKMFGASITSLDQVVNGFAALKEFFGDQQKSRIERISKYSPHNRAQRRAQK